MAHKLVDSFLKDVLQENRTMITEREALKAFAETPVIKEILQEWAYKQAEKRVEVEVEKQQALALQEALLDVLAIRFGKENGKVRRMVLALDNPKKLKAMHRRALKAKSLAPIVAQLQKARARS